MGNIGEAQNLECLLKALSYIEDKKEFKFHIVGSGSSYEKCIKLATDLGVNDVVIFHGRYPKNEMKKFYSMADVCYVSLRTRYCGEYNTRKSTRIYVSRKTDFSLYEWRYC